MPARSLSESAPHLRNESADEELKQRVPTGGDRQLALFILKPGLAQRIR
jgi:hypothetical protein